MDRRHATIFWNDCKHLGSDDAREANHTSQWFRMTERPPATDLRGGKTSEDSFTILMASLVVACAVDFQSDLFSGTALDSTVRPGDSGRPLRSLPGTDRTRSETV